MLMKKRLFVFGIVAALMLSVAVLPLRAQSSQLKVSLGVQGGLDLTEMTFGSKMLSSNNRAGFFVGPSLRFKMPIVGLGIDFSALYDQRNLNVDGEHIHQRSIVLPLNMRCGIDFSDLFKVFLSAGPQVAFNLGNKTFTWNDTGTYHDTFQLRKSTFSVNLGGGLVIGHIEAAVYYNINCGRTGDVSWGVVKDQLSQQTLRSARAETNAWRIALSYYF